MDVEVLYGNGLDDGGDVEEVRFHRPTTAVWSSSSIRLMVPPRSASLSRYHIPDIPVGSRSLVLTTPDGDDVEEEDGRVTGPITPILAESEVVVMLLLLWPVYIVWAFVR